MGVSQVDVTGEGSVMLTLLMGISHVDVIDGDQLG